MNKLRAAAATKAKLMAVKFALMKVQCSKDVGLLTFDLNVPLLCANLYNNLTC